MRPVGEAVQSVGVGGHRGVGGVAVFLKPLLQSRHLVGEYIALLYLLCTRIYPGEDVL